MFDGISIWQLLIILAIVIVVFGTKRLGNIGGDLGNAIKSFKKAMHEDDSKPAETRDADFPQSDQAGVASSAKSAPKD